MSIRVIICIWAIIQATAVLAIEPKLIFALDLIRHGDRTPRLELPNIPHQWNEGLGQLTAKGMQQEYELGLKLRQKYIDKHGLLPTHYQKRTMYVRSTDTDRTLMSAQSFLLGLYPLGTGPATLKGFQPIPIHSVSKDQDILMIDTADKKFQSLAKKTVFNTKQWQIIESSTKKNYAHWSEVTGMKVTSLYDLRSLADPIYIYQLYQIPVPGLSEDEKSKIIQTRDDANILLFKSKAIGKEFGYPILAMIIDYLENASHNNDPLKYVLLSAHDTSLLGLMNALQSPRDEHPPYASCLNFSLYEDNNNLKFVEVTYNEKSVNIPGCHQNMCTIEQMKSLLHS